MKKEKTKVCQLEKKSFSSISKSRISEEIIPQSRPLMIARFGTETG